MDVSPEAAGEMVAGAGSCGDCGGNGRGGARSPGIVGLEDLGEPGGIHFDI